MNPGTNTETLERTPESISKLKGNRLGNPYVPPEKTRKPHTHSTPDSDCVIVSSYIPKEHKPYTDVSAVKSVAPRSFNNRSVWNKDRKRNKKDDKGSKLQGDKVTIGTGPVSSLKAVSPTRKSSESNSSNRHCSGLFISRLEAHCTAQQLQSYIWQHAGHKVKAEKITTKYGWYSSFYVPCNRRMRDDLQNPSIWSKGTLIKLYYV